MAILTDSLVPLLFVIYINTMSSFVSSCLFKVDTKLYHSISNPTSTKRYQITMLVIQHYLLQSAREEVHDLCQKGAFDAIKLYFIEKARMILEFVTVPHR